MKCCLTLSFVSILLAGCGDLSGRTPSDLAGSNNPDFNGAASADQTFVPYDLAGLDLIQTGCQAGPSGCYTVYANSDHFLYLINLMSKTLEPVGPFNAPKVNFNGMMVEDVITDIAVSPTDVIYAVSHTKLYTVNSQTGQVTLVG